MPARLDKAMRDDHGMVFTLHGASDHDLNPITYDEVDKVFTAVRDAASSLEGFSDRTSPFVRNTDGFDACAQAFNGAVLAVHTSSPEPTDDVDGPTGFAIERELEAAGASPGAFVDSHNCLAPGVGGVSFGTPKAKRLRERLREAAADALAKQAGGLRVGVGHVPGWDGSRGMGPMGIQALVVEAGGAKMAWLLLDGNNMVCGLRERLRDRVMELVDEAELLTTDNHVVNVMVGGFNPVGLLDPQGRLEEAVVRAVQEALDGMMDAEVAGTLTEIDEVLVFGKGNTIRLSSSINAAVATAKGALLAAFGFASVVSAFALWLLREGL
jgi:putative membrane protein